MTTSAGAAPSRRLLVVLGALLALLWFGGLGQRALQHPDEGRYAEIPREMLASGDFVTPRLNGLKYFEKPPLQYWATAAAYRVLGTSEWTARLWPALSTFGAILFIGYVGRRLSGRSLGAYAAAALAGTIGFIVGAQILTLDGGLTALLTVAFGAFVVAQEDGLPVATRRRWMALAWLALAAAALAKGPIAVVIPGGALVVYSLATRDWGPWRRLHLLSGLLLFALVAVPWFVLVARANPEFLQFFFVHEHLTRFLTTEHHRIKPWWFFVPVFALGSVPWVTPIAWRCAALWRHAPRNANGFAWQRFALAWAAFVFVFFSASGSKLATYILPMLPPLALVAGWMLERTAPRDLARSLVPFVVVTAALLFVVLVPWRVLVGAFARDQALAAPLQAYRPWLAAGFAVLAAGGVAAIACARRGESGRFAAVVTLGLAIVGGVQLLLVGFDAFGELRSSRALVQAARGVNGAFDAQAPFYQVGIYDQTLPFYLGRTTVLVDYRDEFALGIDAEPDKQIANVDAWQQRWAAAPAGYALLDAGTHARLARSGVPMRVLAESPKRVLVARR
jgi:4-amino-4-deoxy-L-arabinose transferase-like glycosyltransferase